jgi:hypothetical protein
LGIKTVISVDDARPDVAAAEKHGVRNVYLPHGGDSQQRAKELPATLSTVGALSGAICPAPKHATATLRRQLHRHG